MFPTNRNRSISDIPPSTRFWVSLARLYRVAYRRQGRVLAAMELSVSQFDLLVTLLRGPGSGMRMGGLSERLLVTEGNVTGLVRRAEERGLVQRSGDPDDARATRVQLTPQGRQLATTAIPRVEETIARIFDLSETEMRPVARMLRRIRRAAEER
jgi:DNA-binding MarR family transcriptional regulator